MAALLIWNIAVRLGGNDDPWKAATLAGPVDAAQRSGDRDLPAAVLTAIRNCVVSSS